MGFDVLSLQGAWITSRCAPPTLLVDVQNHTTIDVTFPTAVGASFEDPFNYALSDTGKGTLTTHPDYITSLGGNKYRLTWLSGTMFYGENVIITTTGMFDPLDNPLPDYVGSDTAAWAVFFYSSVSNILAMSIRTIRITFALSMLTSDAITASNYTLTGLGKGSLTSSPDSVEIISGTQYLLFWNTGEMFQDGVITVTVNPLMRYNGGVLIDDPKYASGTGIGEQPTVQDVSVRRSLLSNYGLIVNVTFSELIGTGATTLINYSLSGTGKGSIKTNPETITLVSGSTYRLRWTKGKAIAGEDFTITVQNVYDLVGHLIGTPNSGTDYATPRETNLLIQFRETIAPELYETLNTDAIENYTAWKRLFYYWKYRRNMGGSNDWFLGVEPELYFIDPSTDIIDEAPPTHVYAIPEFVCDPLLIDNITLTAIGGAGAELVWYSDDEGTTEVGRGETITIDPPTLTTTYYARWETPYRVSTEFVSVTVPVYNSPTDPVSVTCDRDNICPGS